jgi:hypothetical protein
LRSKNEFVHNESIQPKKEIPMSTTKTTTNANGKKRPQLADSIGRLNSILDGLSDAIPATVAESLQQGLSAAVREAVQQALQEALANPELLATLAAMLPVPQALPVRQEIPATPVRTQMPTTTPSPARRSWLGWLRSGWDRVTQTACDAGEAIRQAGASICASVGAGLEAVWSVRGALAFGVATGAGVGVLAYLGGPLTASLLSGLAAGTLATSAVLIAPVLRFLSLLGRAQ